jgi:hypothetical protein
MSLDLYRVYPHRAGARRGAPGHALHQPDFQRAGRLDNADHFKVLYASDLPEAAVAERLGHRPTWIPEMFSSAGRRPLYLATLRIPGARVLDLDHPLALHERGLKPSTVATRARQITQAWALRVFGERRWRGVRWSSYWEATWGAFGLWDLKGARVVRTEELSVSHPVVVAAAETLGRLGA